MPVPERDWDAAVAALESARHVALACHVDPDGDALGSMLALQQVLRRRGVDAVASFGSSGRGHEPLAVPPQYAFLPGLDGLVPAASFPREPDVLVAFDTGSPDRLGTLRPSVESARTVIVVDHHARGEAFGDIRLCDGAAAATVVLVDELIARLGERLDRDVATCLYVGLVTDTGRFQYACTTPAVMEFGARLLAEGIDHAEINRQVWQAHSLGYLKVLGRAMSRTTVASDASLAWTSVYQSDLADLGITPGELEGIIDVLAGLAAVECAMVLKEQRGAGAGHPASTRWKVSLRSKGGVDVGTVAQALGGGGHAYAAGFSAEAPLDDLVGRVATLLAQAQQSLTQVG